MKQLDFKIESAEQQSDVINFLDNKIYEYNSSMINQFDGETFAKIVRDHKGTIIGGITGWTWAGISEITFLWVDERYRKNGLGLGLLKAGEDEIKKKGCKTILLRSYSFQAPVFYEKNGYKTLYIIDNCPQGYKYHTMLKKVN